jgi:membrane fusion protein, multidrug efflux system
MKRDNMKQIFKLSLAILLAAGFIACNAGAKDKKEEVAAMQKQLAQMKAQSTKLNADIKKLESEIAKRDPSTAKVQQAKLVALTPVTPENFTHYIDLQGKVEAENTYNVMPRGMPGQVRAVYVKEGDRVRKGQLLLKLDDAIIRQNMQTAKLAVANAENVYQRYKNLRAQDIGTEVQLIAYKNAVDQARGALASLQEQAALSNVYSQVNGVAEQVNVRVGETFTGAPPFNIQIVNASNLKVVTDIPETYVSRVKRGTPVVITIPALNRKYNSTVSLISQSIGNTSRGFTIECKLPADANLKANQVATLQIQDYKSPSAIAIPISTVQTDENGKFVLVAKTENNKRVARKKAVGIGELYGDQIEIKAGLQPGDTLITQGFQNLYEGQLITTQK